MGDRPQRLRALRISYAPWAYRRGAAVGELEAAIGHAFGGETVTFASGREALLALFQALSLSPDDEIMMQAYTCVAVPNAVHAAGLKTLYCDIEANTLNIDLEALEGCVTRKTRAVICQHTFGIPADAKRLRAFCDARGLLLIEDCAHVLPDDRGPAGIGRHSDFLLLSFGREKAISGVTGGAIVCRGHADTAKKLRALQATAADLSWWTVARLLEYSQIYAFCRPLYGLGIGKAKLWLAGKLRLLVPIYSAEEKHGRMPARLHRLPNACASLALEQWRRLLAINDHRRLLTEFFWEEARARGWPMLEGIAHGLPLQKFPLFCLHAERIRRTLKKRNIHLHDGWTGCVICPASVDIADAGYTLGEDPQAEAVCQEILSLPTHLTMTLAQAKELVAALDPLLAHA